MTASMYQSGSSRSAADAGAGCERLRVSMSGSDREQVAGGAVGVEDHEVVRAVPAIAFAGELVAYGVGRIRVEAEGCGIEVHPAALHMGRIEVHQHDHPIVDRALRVPDDV